MAEAAPALGARLVWRVGALLLAVADALVDRFPVCAVRGEISGFSRAPSGHCYFNLKDDEGGSAVLRCALFRRAATLLAFTPVNGQRVEVRGRLGVYESRGELQLLVESMQRAGDGELYEQFLRLKARLGAEGLFDASRKRAIPAYPRSIGVVTSLAAAALRDVVSTLRRRAPHVGVIVYPSSVQGVDSPAALCEAIAQAGRRNEVDTLIVARGGGAFHDLWAFNDEAVVRAIAAAPMPVICGVGHETDVTLADHAADLRAPTPTAAAELASPAAEACLASLTGIARRLQRCVRRAQEQGEQRLDRIAYALARPADNLRRRRDALQQTARRLQSAPGLDLARRQALLDALDARRRAAADAICALRGRRLAVLQARVDALDPRRVLARGYAWLADDAGRAVVSTGQLHAGDALQVVLVDGSAGVRITDVSPAPRA